MERLHTSSDLGSANSTPSPVGDDTALFDTAADKYVKETLNDCDLFNMGTYNSKQRTGGINYKSLALLALLMEFLLTWCPRCKADKNFMKDNPW